MKFKGKKAFCFLALKHHSRFLLPITRALEEKGMEVQYLTAPAEMPFELTLQDEGLAYRHTQAYLDPSLAGAIDQAYRQVRSAWKEKVLQSCILRHFTLPVQDKILRMHVDNFYLFRHMFEVERPDFVLALHELNSWGKMLSYLSHEYHVPMITLQEGLYYAPAAVYRSHTEYSSACLVWGKATREVLVRSGGSGAKIFVVGNTHLHSVVARESEPAAVERTRKELKIPDRHQVVTLLMGGLGYDRGFTFPQELLDWARKNPALVLVCKWHPVTNKLAIEEIGMSLQNIPNIRMLQQFDTYRLLAASDVCVVFGNSTTGLEALAFGKPLVEVQLAGLEYSFARQGVAEAASSLSVVPDAIESALCGTVPADRRLKVETYLRDNLHLFDGHSVDRCMDAVEKMLSARQSQRSSKRHCSLGERQDFLCSIIVPFSAPAGTMEALLGVAENTSLDTPYECLISMSSEAPEQHDLVDSLEGDVRVLHAGRTGLGHLYNFAAKQAAGRYLCFLSPGWVPQKGWLEALVKQLEADAEAGVAGGMAIFPTGLLAHSGITLDANLSPAMLYHLLPATLPGANRIRPMRAVKGCLLVRREAFLAAGGFDDGYRSHWCEVDFCLQAGLNGWKTVYTPESLFLCLNDPSDDDEDDRLRFFGKWVGHLWPDQETYWSEDQLDPGKLSRLYENVISGADERIETSTS